MAINLQKKWENLPDHILIDILKGLPLCDRYRASLTCKSWNEAFNLPFLWKNMDFQFYQPRDKRYLECCKKHGSFLQNVKVQLDQSDRLNRQNACDVLQSLACLEKNNLVSLEINFMGENPYFYAGQEFVEALRLLFGNKNKDVTIQRNFKALYLSRLTITLQDSILDTLSTNHEFLEVVDIQNRALICKVSPECLLALVKRCKGLKDLRIHNCSLNEEIISEFTIGERSPLKHLSILCRREEKYAKLIDGNAWVGITQKFPKFRVTLIFDHTCPLHKISEIMNPEIPVAVLRLETYTYIYTEVALAAQIYCDVLEKLVLEAPLSKTSPQLNQALLLLTNSCKKLSSLHVYCILDEQTISRILDINAVIRERKTYTLKHKDNAPPAPWPGDEMFIPGND